MKIIQVKSTNTKVYNISVIIIGISVLVAGLFFLPVIIRNINAEGYGKIGIIAIGIAVFIFMVLLKRILQRKYIVQIDDLLTISRGSHAISTPINSIVMLRLKSAGISNQLRIYTKERSDAFIQFDSMDPKSIMELVTELKNRGEYAPKQQNKASWEEYVNTAVVQSNHSAMNQIREVDKKRRFKGRLVGVIVFCTLLSLLIALFLMNSKEFYEVRDNKVFFGKMEMVGVNPDSCHQFSYNVIKDSSHIYFQGKVLDWADHATFRSLERIFYADKNGIYYEKNNLFSKDRLLPLEGNYDKASFKELGGFFYKDKNNIYHMDINILSNKEPLRKIELPNLDVASFIVLEHNWAADSKTVYFSTWGNLRPCPEIDRPTFEVLDWQVAKDKNNVYYLTRNLKSEGHSATENENYAILTGADASTFERIGTRKYRDKNTEWSIQADGEESPKVNTRDDLN